MHSKQALRRLFCFVLDKTRAHIGGDSSTAIPRAFCSSSIESNPFRVRDHERFKSVAVAVVQSCR
jgi:hypothetical protein